MPTSPRFAQHSIVPTPRSATDAARRQPPCQHKHPLRDPALVREHLLPALDAEEWAALRVVCRVLRSTVDGYCSTPGRLADVLRSMHRARCCPFVARCDASDSLVVSVLLRNFIRESCGGTAADTIDHIASDGSIRQPAEPQESVDDPNLVAGSSDGWLEAPLFAPLRAGLLGSLFHVQAERRIRSHPDCEPQWLCGPRDVAQCLSGALVPFYRKEGVCVSSRERLLRRWGLLRAAMGAVTATHILHAYRMECDGPLADSCPATMMPLFYESRHGRA
eukprot:TRINITY_DN70948_c0_g1_i1.p1 TRINITY_DN70948_c0_g1~~TRINITY_DN70948_c0_g1_i1.p1  ORF type:complete len:277 (+),score=58.90 TRINITY_DN70948_c0_g1_i1:94-924(+)